MKSGPDKCELPSLITNKKRTPATVEVAGDTLYVWGEGLFRGDVLVVIGVVGLEYDLP